MSNDIFIEYYLDRYLSSVRPDGVKTLAHVKRICLVRDYYAIQILNLGIRKGQIERTGADSHSHTINPIQIPALRSES